MNMQKKARVDAIRANTAYPTYRGIIGIITLILMILAGFQALGAIALGFGAGASLHNGFVGFVVLLLGLGFAVLAFFLAKIWNEAAQILVDIGDSVLDANPSVAQVPIMPQIPGLPPNAGISSSPGTMPAAAPPLPIAAASYPADGQ